MFKPNKNQILIAIAVVAIGVTGVLVLANSNSPYSEKLSFLRFSMPMSADAVAKKSVDYLNTSVLQNGQTATLDSFSEESGVVKIKIKIGTQSYDSYATRDGKLLFPEGFALDSKSAAASQPSANVTPANVAKVASTMLDAYVVSDCPYGLQMQRVMAQAVGAIPALANYIKVRYIGSISGSNISSMHDGSPNGLEAKENLKQICLREEQPAKYWPYVACYMKKATGTLPNGMPVGDSNGCSATAGVDTAKLNACILAPARGLSYAKKDFDLNAKYNIQGSPTLVLNGQQISEDAFGGRAPEAIRAIVCNSSTTAPSFCSTKLDTTPAATSFSLVYAGSGATATAAANCAPTTN